MDECGFEFEPCPVCQGEGCYLGHLGAIEWFRCRQCGYDFHLHPKEECYE